VPAARRYDVHRDTAIEEDRLVRASQIVAGPQTCEAELGSLPRELLGYVARPPESGR
jgi:hypothetical protein